MLHRDILILHGGGYLFGLADGFVHILCNIDLVCLAAAAGNLGQLVDFGLDCGQERGDSHSHGGEQLGDQPLTVCYQGQKQMGLLDLLVAVFYGNILSTLDRGQGLLGKLIHIHVKETSFVASQ